VVLQFIDPEDCNCTDCQTGVAVPLRHATQSTLARLVTGELRARFDATVKIHITVTLSPPLLALMRPNGRLPYGATNLLHEAQRWDAEIGITATED